MNSHALSVLEFSRVLALVADRASSPLGAERVRSLVPGSDLAELEAEHRRVAAVRSLVGGDGGWAPEPVPSVVDAIARLRVEGTSWNGLELLGGAQLLASSRRTRDTLGDPKLPALSRAVLAPFTERMLVARREEQEIERSIDGDGEVRDDASPTLRRVRRELRGAAGELVRLLERLMSKLESHQRVDDGSVTVRNGRYVIPIRANARATVGGIVHDSSSTGATLFVEPPAAVEAGNRIRELEAEELREVDRVLRELTELLRPHRERMADALDALIALDALFARARYAVEFRCSPAELVAAGAGFAVRDGRHPLLLAQGAPVVPFDLAMDASERTLLVSGPNTGGKTVLLKALALVSLMSQCGIPAPVGEESTIAVYDDVFADVGDEQSIQASLSTFSAHLKNQGEILARATASSLVLVDELGSGTDPLEGAALGGAILEDLTARGTTTVATTHLGALKELATEVPGVVNASLQFDPVALAPTYRLIKGVPGRSYGISIARRLRLPGAVLARAEERVPRVERDVDALLAELERRETALAQREAQASEVLADAQGRIHKVADRERSVLGRERAVERAAREEARRYALEARAQIEAAIRELKSAGAAAVDDAAKAARRTAERIATEQGEAVERIEAIERRRATTPRAAPGEMEPEPIAVGDQVELSTFGNRAAQVLDLRDGTAQVAVGAMKMTVPVASLRRAAEQQRRKAEIVVPMMGDVPEPHVQSEVDLRGMRVGEVDDLLMHAIDAGVRADLRELRIIHGKGTGALRERVSEMLRKDTRVGSFRLGLWNEGGAGVTIAELR